MENKELYPLVMEPSFRHGAETPWGGHALRKNFGKDAPEEITGESLEISALPGHESRVANGVHQGKTLQELFLLWGEDLTGKKEERFPLLLKLLDAQQDLSVQVHPSDEYALAHEGKLGKSEAWYILNAVPGAGLVYGVDTHGEDLRAIVESGRLEECLHTEKVHPGDVFYIPSGTIHALGPGIQCYEIQQSSDVTYRFWDWGRVGKDGQPRELHMEKALAVSRPDCLPELPEQVKKPYPGGSATLLVDDPHFQLYAVDLEGTMPLPVGDMLLLTATVPCVISWGTNEHQSLNPYQSVLIPAHMRAVSVSGEGRLLAVRGR